MGWYAVPVNDSFTERPTASLLAHYELSIYTVLYKVIRFKGVSRI